MTEESKIIRHVFCAVCATDITYLPQHVCGGTPSFCTGCGKYPHPGHNCRVVR